MTHSQEQGCVFCKIIDRELPARIVYEDEHVIGILDVVPRFGKGQCLVIPKKHVDQFYNMDDDDVARLFKAVRQVARKIKKAFQADMVGTFSRGNTIRQHTHIIVYPALAGPRPENGMMPEESMRKNLRELSTELSQAGVQGAAAERIKAMLRAMESLAPTPKDDPDEIAERIRNAVP